MLRVARLFAVPVVAVVISQFAGIAFAHHTYYTNMYKVDPETTAWDCEDGGTICRTDNATLTWNLAPNHGLAAPADNSIDIILGGNKGFDNSDLSVSRQIPVVTSGSAETDIIYRQGSVAGTSDAFTICDDAVSELKCDQHEVTFEQTAPSASLICHESGHAVGLLHGRDGGDRREFNTSLVANDTTFLQCMRTPLYPGDGDWLGTHNVSEINAVY